MRLSLVFQHMKIPYTNQIQPAFISLLLTTWTPVAHPSLTPVILFCFQFDFFVLKMGHTVFVFLWLTYFIKQNVLQFQPVCYKWWVLILLCNWTICPCMPAHKWVCMYHNACMQLAGCILLLHHMCSQYWTRVFRQEPLPVEPGMAFIWPLANF